MLRNRLKLTASVSVLVLVAAAVVVTRDAEVGALANAVKTKAGEVSAPVNGTEVFTLPFAAQQVAVHWPGHHEAQVDVAFSVNGIQFGTPSRVLHDEVGEGHPSGETFGAVLAAGGATHVRVSVDRPIGRMTVLPSPTASRSMSPRHPPRRWRSTRLRASRHRSSPVKSGGRMKRCASEEKRRSGRRSSTGCRSSSCTTRRQATGTPTLQQRSGPSTTTMPSHRAGATSDTTSSSIRTATCTRGGGPAKGPRLPTP